MTGCAILGLGAYIQANLESFGDFMIDYHVNSGVILMVMGGIILFVAFLGCCGAGTGKQICKNFLHNILRKTFGITAIQFDLLQFL